MKSHLKHVIVLAVKDCLSSESFTPFLTTPISCPKSILPFQFILNFLNTEDLFCSLISLYQELQHWLNFPKLESVSLKDASLALIQFKSSTKIDSSLEYWASSTSSSLSSQKWFSKWILSNTNCGWR